MNFLIVEDMPLATEYLKSILIKLGFKDIYFAQSCQEAKEVVSNQNISLIFMDINIKGSIDGIKCASLINEIQNIPMIYTTAYKDSQTINETMDTNIYGYIFKPFQIQDVQATLLLALKKIELDSQEKEEGENIEMMLEKRHLFDDYYFDEKTKVLFKNNKMIKLHSKEKALLNFFIENNNELLNNEIIKDTIWSEEISDSSLRDTVYRLKKKIPNLPLENVSKMGYILNL